LESYGAGLHGLELASLNVPCEKTAIPEETDSLWPSHSLLLLLNTASPFRGCIPAKVMAFRRHLGDLAFLRAPRVWPWSSKTPDAPDPAAPKRIWVHWVVYDIPVRAPGLAEGVGGEDLPEGSREGLNDWKKPGYGGPCPPVGRPRHSFRLYALACSLGDLKHVNVGP
jgi:hypothetical protein